MAAIVNIDQPLTQLSLAAGERRSLGFDLVNVAERSLHVTVTTTPAPGRAEAVPAWVTVAGEATFRLAPKETRKVELEVAPPAGAVPVSTGFRLKVFEVSLPEENNSFSEPVQVTVAAAAPTEPAPKPPWKLLGAIAAAVLLLIVAGAGWYFWPTKTLPDVEGETLAEAISQLEQAGVARASIVADRPIAADADDRVTRQTPAAGTSIEDGLTVTLTAPRLPETITLPRLPDDATGEVAQATYGELGLEVELAENAEAEGKVPGQVIAVEPPPGSPVAEDETVRVTVLSATATMPDLKNGTISRRERSRLEANFDLIEDRIEDTERDPGFVISQSHTGELERGTTVMLVTTYRPRTRDDVVVRDHRVMQFLENNPNIQRRLEADVQQFRPNLQLFQPQR